MSAELNLKELVTEAHNLNRVTPEGRELGAHLARLAEPGIQRLIAEGEPDARCESCAFRAGTVPNGCAQTIMDAMKSVLEGGVENIFYCHAKHPVGTHICHGYYASRVQLRGKGEVKVPWEFSPYQPHSSSTDKSP